MNFLSWTFSFAIIFCVIYSLVDGRAVNRYHPRQIDAYGHDSMQPYGSMNEPEVRFQSSHRQHGELRYRGRGVDRPHHQHHDATDPTKFENHLMRELRRYLAGTSTRNHHTFGHGVYRYGNQEGVL